MANLPGSPHVGGRAAGPEEGDADRHESSMADSRGFRYTPRGALDLGHTFANMNIVYSNPGLLSAGRWQELEHNAWEEGVHIVIAVGVGWTGGHYAKGSTSDRRYWRVAAGAERRYPGYAGGCIIAVHPGLARFVTAVWPTQERLLSIHLQTTMIDCWFHGFYSYLAEPSDFGYRTKRTAAWDDFRDTMDEIKNRRCLHVGGMDGNLRTGSPQPGCGALDPVAARTVMSSNAKRFGDLCRAWQATLLNTHRLDHTGPGAGGTCHTTLGGWSRIDYIFTRRVQIEKVKWIGVGEPALASFFRAPVDHLPLRTVLDLRLPQAVQPRLARSLGRARPLDTALLEDPRRQTAFRKEMRTTMAMIDTDTLTFRDPAQALQKLPAHLQEMLASLDAELQTMSDLADPGGRRPVVLAPHSLTQTASFVHTWITTVTQETAERHFSKERSDTLPDSQALLWKRDFPPDVQEAIIGSWEHLRQAQANPEDASIREAAREACKRKRQMILEVKRRKKDALLLKVEEAADRGDLRGVSTSAKQLYEKGKHGRTPGAWAKPGGGRCETTQESLDALEHELAKPPRNGTPVPAQTLLQQIQDEASRPAAMTHAEAKAFLESELPIPAVAKSFARQPKWRSVWPGSPPTRVLRLAAPMLAGAVFVLYVLAVAHGSIPQEASDAFTIALYKGKGSFFDLANFRFICLLQRIWFPLMQALAKRIQSGLLDRKKWLGWQFGFLPKRDTVLALWMIRTVLFRLLRLQLTTVVVFVDLAKAFDSLDRSKFDDALAAIEAEVGWKVIVAATHRSTRYWLEVAGEKRLIDVPKGVRQGSVEGPVLFILLYCLALHRARRSAKRLGLCPPSSLDHGETHPLDWIAFADDLTALLIADDPDELDLLMATIHDTFAPWGMEVNYAKTNFLVMRMGPGSRAARAVWPDQLEIHLADGSTRQIAQVTSAVLLGATISNTGSTAPEVTRRRSRADAQWARIGKRFWTARALPLRFRIRFWAAIVQSSLMYALETFGTTLSPGSLAKLEAVRTRHLSQIMRLTIIHVVILFGM